MSDKGLCVRLPHGRGDALREMGMHVQLEVAPLSPPTGELHLGARLAWRDEEDDGECLVGLELADESGSGSDALCATWAALRRSVQQRVLIVDPDPEAASLYACLNGPFQTYLTGDPEQALGYLREHSENVSVIVCVEQLPGMHCLTFFERAAAAHPRLRSMRIVVSEYTAVGQVQMLINQGQLFGYVRKPLSPKELGQAVERAAQAGGLAH